MGEAGDPRLMPSDATKEAMVRFQEKRHRQDGFHAKDVQTAAGGPHRHGCDAKNSEPVERSSLCTLFLCTEGRHEPGQSHHRLQGAQQDVRQGTQVPVDIQRRDLRTHGDLQEPVFRCGGFQALLLPNSFGRRIATPIHYPMCIEWRLIHDEVPPHGTIHGPIGDDDDDLHSERELDQNPRHPGCHSGRRTGTVRNVPTGGKQRLSSRSTTM